MPSPFPGMNPYMEEEGLWPDVHHRLISRIAEVLTPQVRPKYLASIGRDVYIHELSFEERRLLGKPDVFVAANRGGGSGIGGPAGQASVPVLSRIPLALVDETELGVVEIRERHSREVVLTIEVLSPTNKRADEHREQYLRKRQACLRSPAHFLEIDLLRANQKMPVENPPESDYLVVLSRANERPAAELFPTRLRDRLPVVPIPLGKGDPDASLDLQRVLHDVYDLAAYGDYIYEQALSPPFREGDRVWAESIATAAVRDASGR